ncbi:MAG: hypothetical protein PF693_09605 [Spirochaetia bacterium]|jgi:hypothetical protein|nr:hypothetical protein [Spirochaetia bacterium]
MEIQASTITSTVSLANLVRATSGQGKVRFPVNSSDIAYTNFKNIKIVPSGTSGGSYSVSRLRALDNLIEQLNRLKGQNKIETPELNNLNNNTLNTLISKLSEEIHTKLDTKTAFKPTMESTGLLFDILL